MLPSNFLRASDLLADDDFLAVDVTIAKVAQDEALGDGSETWVVHFREFDKGLILNAANILKLGELCGDGSEDWLGKRVRLYAAPVFFRDQELSSIRIKIKPARPSRQRNLKPPLARNE
jgi:hypothetical protein